MSFDTKYYNPKPFQPKVQQAFIPKQKILEPASYIPSREFNEVDKIDLFTSVSDGDYNKIKQLISDKNLTYTLQNKDKETVILVVLRNNNLSEINKLDLVKFFVNNGVSQFAADIKNITPLHLAAKYQYETIVKYLLEQKSDISYLDNSRMSPFHYASMGMTDVCEKKDEKKEENIIKEDNLEKELRELSSIIIEILLLKDSNFFADLKEIGINIKDIDLTTDNISTIFENINFDNKKSFNDAIDETYNLIIQDIAIENFKTIDDFDTFSQKMINENYDDLNTTTQLINLSKYSLITNIVNLYNNRVSDDIVINALHLPAYNLDLNEQLLDKIKLNKTNLFKNINNDNNKNSYSNINNKNYIVLSNYITKIADNILDSFIKFRLKNRIYNKFKDNFEEEEEIKSYNMYNNIDATFNIDFTKVIDEIVDNKDLENNDTLFVSYVNNNNKKIKQNYIYDFNNNLCDIVTLRCIKTNPNIIDLLSNATVNNKFSYQLINQQDLAGLTCLNYAILNLDLNLIKSILKAGGRLNNINFLDNLRDKHKNILNNDCNFDINIKNNNLVSKIAYLLNNNMFKLVNNNLLKEADERVQVLLNKGGDINKIKIKKIKDSFDVNYVNKKYNSVNDLEDILKYIIVDENKEINDKITANKCSVYNKMLDLLNLQVNNNKINNLNKNELVAHLMKTVVASSLFFSLKRAIGDAVIKNNKLNEEYLTNIFKDDELEDYILGDMLNVYLEDKEDKDKVFDNVISIISSNRYLNVTKDSKFIQNIKVKILDEYKKIYIEYVTKISLIIDNYSKYSETLSKYNEIYDLLKNNKNDNYKCS
jgi:ankyrin repeat protein